MVQLEIRHIVLHIQNRYADEIKEDMKNSILEKIKSIPASDMVRVKEDYLSNTYSIRILIDMDSEKISR